MPCKKHKTLVALFFLCLTGCVSQTDDWDFDKQQAAKARIELGLGYLAQQNAEQAKLNLDKALAYAPDYYLSHSALAYYYQLQGDVAKAREAYLKAIKADKNQGDTFNNYGAFLCSQGQFTEAYEQFDTALNTPNYYRHTDTYENIVLCALAQNDQIRYEENLTLLEKSDSARAQKFRQSDNGSQ